jgi:DNA-binding MarR family transcriptional regulator
MNFNLLKEVIGYLEEFETQSDSGNLSDFIIWINNEVFSPKKNSHANSHDDLLIAFRIMFLNKELKKQTKEVLSHAKVSSIDEYSFLLHLDNQMSFRKMEIIALHNLEAPTGIEIIKRLLKNNLIEEYADTEDRRAKRIKITEMGAKELEAIQPIITEIFTSFSSSLELNEKIQIAGILDKLITSKIY